MPDKAISNTSPLLYLHRCGGLAWLSRLFTLVRVPGAVAFELADFGINVNCLCPGITENTGVWDTASSGYINNLGLAREDVVNKFTSKVPLKRLAKISDIVEVTYFMASKGAGYMTGQSINVTGGREMH